MGYDVHITRKDEWFDEDDNQISIEEWKEYVNSDPEMRLDNFAEAETPSGILRLENEGLSVWLNWSKHELDGNMAWMAYFNGNITVKNPDDEMLIKMYKIAKSLNAKVQGDEGELYNENGLSNFDEPNKPNTESAQIKKWWQFWK